MNKHHQGNDNSVFRFLVSTLNRKKSFFTNIAALRILFTLNVEVSKNIELDVEEILVFHVFEFVEKIELIKHWE